MARARSTNAPPITRRRGEARAAILQAARSRFGESGYYGTSMRDVAADAEVSEALLYRYFPSKTILFNEAVIEPYGEFIQRFIDSWKGLDRRLSNDEMVSRFVTALYDFVLHNRNLLFALVAAHRHGSQHPDKAGILNQGIKRLAESTAQEANERGLEHVDLELAVACTISMVFSMVILDDLLFPRGKTHPSKHRIVEQISRYAAAGVQQRAGNPLEP